MVSTVEDAIALVKSKSIGRTRWDGQEPFVDELLVAEIERLRKERDEYKAACEHAIVSCRSRKAGNTANPFAWLPQRKWDEFVSMVKQAADVAGGKL